MKKILIAGANSYIGTSFETYMKQWSDEYQVDTIDMIDGTWRDKSFVGYDTIIHLAAIVHMKETKKNKDLYFKVNRDLAYETALKAKHSGVKQFIFMSTMSVYGMNTGVITKETTPNPKTYYGKSKLEAENLILPLHDDKFIITILRPPMIYGKGCKGNYQTLSNWAKKLPIFPNIENKRSMVYIGNLSYFIKYTIDNESTGYYFPQNSEYVSTRTMAKQIAEINNNKIKSTNFFNWIIKLLIKLHISIFCKLFGDLTYEKNNVIDNIAFDISIEMSEM